MSLGIVFFRVDRPKVEQISIHVTPAIVYRTGENFASATLAAILDLLMESPDGSGSESIIAAARAGSTTAAASKMLFTPEH